MAACFAARETTGVTLIDSTPDGGRKILISGGGRCNILPSEPTPERFVTDSSRNTLRNILKSWPLEEQKSFFAELLGGQLVLEDETGKLFPPSDRARDVRDALLRLARDRGVRIIFGSRVREVRRSDDLWSVKLEGGTGIDARRVIIATGGLSVPKTGSDGFGLGIARSLGHVVHPTYPALTPITHSNESHKALAGLSLTVSITETKSRDTSTGGFLFTHRGYSGPSVLDISHHVTRGTAERLLINWSPPMSRRDWDVLITGGRGRVRSAVSGKLPNRLADLLLDECGIPIDTDVSQLTRDARTRLTELVAEYPMRWDGDGGYAKAEVTGGGVALDQVDRRTMESRVEKGLFFCGEVLDAFGPIGGHNFQWAWATGRAAGIGAASSFARAD